YQTSDIDALYEAVMESRAELTVWLPWCHEQYGREDSIEWVRTRPVAWKWKEEFSFVIADAKTNRFLGASGINQFNGMYNFANLGYWVRTSETKRGVATRATLLTAEFGFSSLHLNRIEIIATVGNIASQRVAEKAGARLEGILRRRIPLRDKIHDATLYSLIPEDIGLINRI
ncbi:MAG: GNAT family N-acetyltransferase, partial [Chlorobiales bacterium]|nr:GNAT family N-acetyltransferase [Chlorobiales bacterium]